LMTFGSEHGPGFGYRNQWYYRLGFEYQLDCCWTLRTGFIHVTTPIRGSDAALNSLMLDLVRNYVTFGATYKYDSQNEFSFFFAYGFPHTVKGTHVIPFIQFGGGDVSIREEKYAAGISWGWNY